MITDEILPQTPGAASSRRLLGSAYDTDSVSNLEVNRQHDAGTDSPGARHAGIKMCVFGVLGCRRVEARMSRPEDAHRSSFGATPRINDGAYHDAALNIGQAQVVGVRDARTRNNLGGLCGSGIGVKRSAGRRGPIGPEPGGQNLTARSEERRVGKECKSRWWP